MKISEFLILKMFIVWSPFLSAYSTHSVKKIFHHMIYFHKKPIPQSSREILKEDIEHYDFKSFKSHYHAYAASGLETELLCTEAQLERYKRYAVYSEKFDSLSEKVNFKGLGGIFLMTWGVVGVIILNSPQTPQELTSFLVKLCLVTSLIGSRLFGSMIEDTRLQRKISVEHDQIRDQLVKIKDFINISITLDQTIDRFISSKLLDFSKPQLPLIIHVDQE